MPTRCVIYDCDGVLFDSLEANRALYNHIAVSMGRGAITEDELACCHTSTVRESIHCLFKDDPEGEARGLQFLSDEIDFRDYIPYLRMEPHVLETIAALKERDLLTAICTNRTTSMPHLMERFQLGPYFDMVMTALDVEHPKPHPESVERILAGLRVAPGETLYVGDSEVDMKTAQAADVRFVSYKNEAISTGILITDHRDILKFL